MRKASFYFACFFTLLLMGCGDTSGDPTAQITKLEALPADVSPGSSTVITATVVKVVGKSADTTAEATVTAPGWGENVAFKLLTANGGQLSPLAQKTDGNGEARTVYTAGNNLSNDTIQATLDNGMSATIVIKKTGSLVGVIISALAAAPTTVTENQTSVITAKVTDGGGTNPMLGEPVTFTMATNESGACFINAANACVGSITVNSNAGGNAVALYRAGGNRSTEEVHDTVRGSLANGSSNAVLITRSAGPAGAVLSTLAASPTVVNGGQTSVIMATVTGGTSSGANEVVTLTIPVNNSGASFINAAGASVSTITIRTGSGGTAAAIYQAGTNGSATTVQDTVQGILSNGAMNAVTITVNSGATGYIVGVSADPSVLASKTSVSLVTATVVDTAGIPKSGASVKFECPGGVCTFGSVEVPGPVTTDGAGNAVSSYRGKNNALAGSDVIVATVTIPGVAGTLTGAVTISVP